MGNLLPGLPQLYVFSVPPRPAVPVGPFSEERIRTKKLLGCPAKGTFGVHRNPVLGIWWASSNRALSSLSLHFMQRAPSVLPVSPRMRCLTVAETEPQADHKGSVCDPATPLLAPCAWCSQRQTNCHSDLSHPPFLQD